MGQYGRLRGASSWANNVRMLGNTVNTDHRRESNAQTEKSASQLNSVASGFHRRTVALTLSKFKTLGCLGISLSARPQNSPAKNEV